MNIYETLKEITKEEELQLSNAFGEFWITKFFNIYHISSFVNKIIENGDMKKELLKKYDNIWLQNFINKFKNEIIFKKIYYSYSELIKFQYKVKMGKKLEKLEIEKDEIENIDFKKPEKLNQKNILYTVSELLKQDGGSKSKSKSKMKLNLIGGSEDDEDIEDLDIQDESEDMIDNILNENDDHSDKAD